MRLVVADFETTDCMSYRWCNAWYHCYSAQALQITTDILRQCFCAVVRKTGRRMELATLPSVCGNAGLRWYRRIDRTGMLVCFCAGVLAVKAGLLLALSRTSSAARVFRAVAACVAAFGALPAMEPWPELVPFALTMARHEDASHRGLAWYLCNLLAEFCVEVRPRGLLHATHGLLTPFLGVPGPCYHGLSLQLDSTAFSGPRRQ